MQHEIRIPGLDALDAAAAQFLKETASFRLIAFFAPMGAGKTTFTTALCRQLGVREDAVCSPTFTIVNEYRTAAGEALYHFDFYRIEHPADVLDIGFYDYIDSGALCLMEWPENIGDLLPEEALRVEICVEEDGCRVLRWDDAL